MILACDLGRAAGFAVGAAHPPQLFEHHFSQDIGAMMLDFESVVRGLLRRHEPTMLAWERPFITAQRMDAQGEIRTQRLYGQSAVLAKLTHEYGLKSATERPATLRKEILGKGNATPAQIMAFCHRNGVEPMNEHCADAYIVWRMARQRFL